MFLRIPNKPSLTSLSPSRNDQFSSAEGAEPSRAERAKRLSKRPAVAAMKWRVGGGVLEKLLYSGGEERGSTGKTGKRENKMWGPEVRRRMFRREYW